MLLLAIIETAIGGFAIGWFGHVYYLWHKHNWEHSCLRRAYLLVWRKKK
jgi:hypothetical protein